MRLIIRIRRQQTPFAPLILVQLETIQTNPEQQAWSIHAGPSPTPLPAPAPTPLPTPAPSTAPPSTAAPSSPPSTAAPTSLTCTNGVLDGTETDIDCGGGFCDKCDVGATCDKTADCYRGVCNDNVCDPRPSAAPSPPPTAIPASVPTFAPIAIARVIGTLVGWEKPDKKEHREACYAEKALGCALMIGLCCIIWLDPHNDGKGVYDVLLRPWLLDIDGEHYFEWYFWMRTKMDFLSSVPGLCFAAVYTPFRDAWPFGISRLARWGMGACASTLIALAIWVSQLPQYCCDGGADYRSVNPYVGTLWIPFYLLARNAIPALSRRIMKPIEWVGMHSLEFYLLQFHVFLTDGSHQILYIIPKEDWGYTNMLLVGCIYFVCCIKALEITNVLRSVAWRADKWKVAPGVGRDSVVFTYMCSLRARPRKIPRQTSRNDFDSTELEKLDQAPPPQNRRFRGLARTCLRSRMSAKATDPPPTLPPSPLDALQPYRPPPWTLG